MIEQEMVAPVAILAILRGDETVRGVADRMGVAEAQVERWKDMFVVAGTLALSKARGARQLCAVQMDGSSSSSSCSSSGDPSNSGTDFPASDCP